MRSPELQSLGVRVRRGEEKDGAGVGRRWVLFYLYK